MTVARPGRPDPAPAPRLLPAAVLWDLDGTLVDTEPYWIECEYRLVAQYDGTWSDDHAHHLVGSDLLVSAAYLRDVGGVPLPPLEIIERLLDGVTERVARHVPWRPGARELLTALGAAGVPCAMVTMSYRRLADAVDAALPPGSFQAIVAGDDVTRGKPDPEPYLAAAALVGQQPAECVAIEDSPTGLASAVAAGVPTLGVQSLLPLEPGPGREIVRTLSGWTPAALGELITRVGRPVGRS